VSHNGKIMDLRRFYLSRCPRQAIIDRQMRIPAPCTCAALTGVEKGQTPLGRQFCAIAASARPGATCPTRALRIAGAWFQQPKIIMNQLNNPRRTGMKQPDESNHSKLEEEVLNEEMPVSNPKKQDLEESEEFPGKDDEPEPIPPPDHARD